MTTGRPATRPAKSTVPGPALRTTAPAAAARSTPRWPGSHGRGGGSNRRTGRGGPSTGQRNRPAGVGSATGTVRAATGTVGVGGSAGQRRDQHRQPAELGGQREREHGAEQDGAVGPDGRLAVA